MTFDNFEKYLKETYPKMYDDVYCGVYIDKGWYHLIDMVSEIIYSHVKSSNDARQYYIEKQYEKIPDEIEYPKVVQIKEKYGMLRFYADNTDKYMNGVIDMAEKMSCHICEVCGAKGELRTTGWWKTLCDKHYNDSFGRPEHVDYHPV
jgi:hypothetical protein